ncbi:MAG: dienelactone hydrolase family protein [Myxococcota bacterium]|nr:dienelactone hydrolase family protein [Myxococcota bacterium]
MTERIRIADDVDGELATPAGDGKVPGLIVVHEFWGMNDDIRSMCDRFAGEGFLALAPDLYHGESATDASQAAMLMQKLSTSAAMQDVKAAVARLQQDPRCNGKIAITGFCMGGAIAFAAATSVEGLAVAVPFYGIPIPGYFDATKVKCPIQAHFAKQDQFADAGRAAAFRDEVHAHGGSMELHVYDAGHAFMREKDPSAYDEASAKAAWPRAIAFLKQHLQAQPET